MCIRDRNKNYWQSGKPYLDEVSFSYIPEDTQRVEQLKGGEVSVISAVPPSQVSSLCLLYTSRCV